MTDSEPKSSDFRIKPKTASKPENDMYERMQMEQAMRLAEFEQKQNPGQKSSAQADKARFPKKAEQAQNAASARSAERRNVATEKTGIQKERGFFTEEKAENAPSQPNGKKQGDDYAEMNNEVIELSEDERIEKERMEEIQALAREQARFEIEARGLPKEEKTLQEKERMERLHQLAREQARFEYDQRRAKEKESERIDRVKSNNVASDTENIAKQTKYQASSKQQETRREEQGRTSLFQTADTPSVEENMQNRVRQVREEFSGQLGDKKPKRQTREKKEEKFDQFAAPMKDQTRQESKSSNEEEALMGTKKKKTEGRGGVFENPRVTLEKETAGGEKARLEQLENLAKKQAQYKKDRTMSASGGKSSQELNKKGFFAGQIIDVEAAEDDSGEVLKNENVTTSTSFQEKGPGYKTNDKNLEDESRSPSPSQQESRREKTTLPENERKTFTMSDKRKKLEAQARQRSKQQYRRSDKMQTEQKGSVNQKRIVPDSATRASVIVEKKEPETLVPVVSERQSSQTKQQQDIADVIMKSDGSYQPSPKALADTARMLKEVRGFSLSDYSGSKEFIHKKSNVSVYVGRTLSIPVRVSTPGSFIEFSIAKKASDFDMTILAVPDKGYAFDIKVRQFFPRQISQEIHVHANLIVFLNLCIPCAILSFHSDQNTTNRKQPPLQSMLARAETSCETQF